MDYEPDPDRRALNECMPRVLPAAWQEHPKGLHGLEGRVFSRSDGLRVIATVSIEPDQRRWLHVSCSRSKRIPSHEDLLAVKELFVGRDRLALQVFPPADEYVNFHPHTLHLWCALTGERITPDFRKGGLI